MRTSPRELSSVRRWLKPPAPPGVAGDPPHNPREGTRPRRLWGHSGRASRTTPGGFLHSVYTTSPFDVTGFTPLYRLQGNLLLGAAQEGTRVTKGPTIFFWNTSLTPNAPMSSNKSITKYHTSSFLSRFPPRPMHTGTECICTLASPVCHLGGKPNAESAAGQLTHARMPARTAR